jgi:hypothetical protein
MRHPAITPSSVLVFILVLVTYLHTADIQCMQTLSMYSSVLVRRSSALRGRTAVRSLRGPARFINVSGVRPEKNKVSS